MKIRTIIFIALAFVLFFIPGESAALRNLANAARVLEGNPALMNLRVL